MEVNHSNCSIEMRMDIIRVLVTLTNRCALRFLTFICIHFTMHTHNKTISAVFVVMN